MTTLSRSEIILNTINYVIQPTITAEIREIQALDSEATEVDRNHVAPFLYFCRYLGGMNKLALISEIGRSAVEKTYIADQAISVVLYEMANMFWFKVLDHFDSFEEVKNYVLKIPRDAFLVKENNLESTDIALSRIFNKSELITKNQKRPDENWDGLYLFCYLLAIHIPYSIFADEIEVNLV